MLTKRIAGMLLVIAGSLMAGACASPSNIDEAYSQSYNISLSGSVETRSIFSSHNF